MAKRLGYVLLIFGILVGIQYLLSGFRSLAGSLSFGSMAVNTPPAPGAGLTSINVASFAPNGPGWTYITQGYGVTPYSRIYPHDWHDGIDVAAVYGAPVYGITNGTVIATGNQDDFCYHRGFGKYIAVKDTARGVILWYGHLGEIDVTAGQSISEGTRLGTIGTTGLETGTHLHFSVFRADDFTMPSRDGCGPEPTGKDTNPLTYLKNF